MGRKSSTNVLSRFLSQPAECGFHHLINRKTGYFLTWGILMESRNETGN